MNTKIKQISEPVKHLKQFPDPSFTWGILKPLKQWKKRKRL